MEDPGYTGEVTSLGCSVEVSIASSQQEGPGFKSVPMWVLSMWNLYVLPMSGASFHIDLCRGETVVSGQGVLPYPSEFSGVSG